MVEMQENPGQMDPEAQGAVGLGLRLRLAREARGWSIAEVAQRLCLNKQVIVDIESEEYTNMPGVVYLRGFTRAYAKLLELPVEEVMRDFDALGLQQKSSQPRLQLIRTSSLKSKSKGRWLSILTVVIIVVMVGLVVIWWHNKSARPSQSPFSTSANEINIPTAVQQRAEELAANAKTLNTKSADVLSHKQGLAQRIFPDHQESQDFARARRGNSGAG